MQHTPGFFTSLCLVLGFNIACVHLCPMLSPLPLTDFFKAHFWLGNLRKSFLMSQLLFPRWTRCLLPPAPVQICLTAFTTLIGNLFIYEVFSLTRLFLRQNHVLFILVSPSPSTVAGTQSGPVQKVNEGFKPTMWLPANALCIHLAPS